MLEWRKMTEWRNNGKFLLLLFSSFCHFCYNSVIPSFFQLFRHKAIISSFFCGYVIFPSFCHNFIIMSFSIILTLLTPLYYSPSNTTQNSFSTFIYHTPSSTAASNANHPRRRQPTVHLPPPTDCRTPADCLQRYQNSPQARVRRRDLNRDGYLGVALETASLFYYE